MPPKKPRKVMCLKGCGDIGIDEFNGICLDCYTKQKVLADHVTQAVVNTPATSNSSKPFKLTAKEQWHEFKSAPREANRQVVVDNEISTFTSQVTLTHENNLKLQLYMVASDAGEEVDRTTWCKNQPDCFTPSI